MIPSLQGDAIEDYAIRVVEQWRLGDARRDDGLLFLVSTGDRAMRIEVGHGLEGAIPDVVASRVIRDVVTPRFQAGDMAGGIDAGIDALMRAAAGESIGPAPSTRAPPPGGGDAFPFAGVVLFIVASFVSRAPLLLRVVVLAAVGGALGWFVLGGVVWALVGVVVGALVGALVSGRGGRSGRRRSSVWLPTGGGWSSSSSSFGGGSGFSGGGGSFGGGGASGRW